jgi:regulator of protease activity HflC (stomatin/prohibitin superfamily)
MKKAAILRAEGEAEAARLVAEAVGKAGPGIKFSNDRFNWYKEDRSSSRNSKVISK